MPLISQREARRLRKQVEALQRQIRGQYIGREIARHSYDEGESPVWISIRTARTLDHAVVAIADDNGTVRFVALPHPSESI